MAPSSKPTFLVNPHSDPVLVRIEGRASLVNSASLKDFFEQMFQQGKRHFVVDFLACASMDSTFLGVLAGAAIQLRRLQPPGSLILARLDTRNLELVHNLGLHRLAHVDPDPIATSPHLNGTAQALPPAASNEVRSARLVLEAHESLINADPSNAAKFQDVLAFLRNRIGSTPTP